MVELLTTIRAGRHDGVQMQNLLFEILINSIQKFCGCETDVEEFLAGHLFDAV